MAWLLDLLTGKIKQRASDTDQKVKVPEWFNKATEEPTIEKTASIDDERMKHIQNLSNDALAHIYTETSLKKENKSIVAYYVEEYNKNKDAVLKDRAKIEKALFELIPPHSQENRFFKLAAKSKANVLDVDSIWIVKDIDGQEVIVRATPDATNMKKESIKEVKIADTIYNPNDLVKNVSCKMAENDELGFVEEFDNIFLDASFICCNFEKTGRVWVKHEEVHKLSAEEVELVKTAKEYASFYGPLSDYMLTKFKVILKDSGLKQLELEINSALGKKVSSFSEVPDTVLDKVANSFIQDPDYSSLYDRPIGGQEQKTDNLNQQVPVVFRTVDDDAHNPNTKDFGEVYHQDKLSPEKQSSIILSKLDKQSAVQYVDESGQVKKPEELGVTNTDTAPEEITSGDGKKYKKQKLA